MAPGENRASVMDPEGTTSETEKVEQELDTHNPTGSTSEGKSDGSDEYADEVSVKTQCFHTKIESHAYCIFLKAVVVSIIIKCLHNLILFQPDETLGERLWGLTEMFPESVRDITYNVTVTTTQGIKSFYSFSRNAVWFVVSSSVILFAPLIFEVERAQMEDMQRTQQKQVSILIKYLFISLIM